MDMEYSFVEHSVALGEMPLIMPHAQTHQWNLLSPPNSFKVLVNKRSPIVLTFNDGAPPPSGQSLSFVRLTTMVCPSMSRLGAMELFSGAFLTGTANSKLKWDAFLPATALKSLVKQRLESLCSIKSSSPRNVWLRLSWIRKWSPAWFQKIEHLTTQSSVCIGTLIALAWNLAHWFGVHQGELRFGVHQGELRFAVQLLQGMTEASGDLHFGIQALVHWCDHALIQAFLANLLLCV